MLMLSYINSHIIHPFSILSLLFLILIFFLIDFPTYYHCFANISPPFYLFISLLLSTLISFFLYPFIFLYFLLFLFPTSYYKFTVLFSILFIVFSHTKCYFSLSLFHSPHTKDYFSLFLFLIFFLHFW